MSCEAASWIPNAVAATLPAETAQPVIAWLTAIRASIEEYDPLIIVRPPSPEEPAATAAPDSAFDGILSQLGKEIYKLDQYQQNLGPDEKEVSLSILNLFDECLGQMSEDKPADMTVPVENGVDRCSGGESTLSNNYEQVQFVEVIEQKSVSEPAQDEELSEINGELKRTRLKTSSSTSSKYDNVETMHDSQEWSKLIESDSDSESTCWSYKECSDAENDVNNAYAAVWSHSSGFHNSDAILRRVLSQNKATVSRLSFDTVSELEVLEPAQYTVYALEEVGDGAGTAGADRCVDSPVAAMTPDRPCDDGGYEPVRDALTDENIYEEIEYGYSYTDEGCSCGTSVEVESCSISASSEGVGRESPLYANLRDHDAYAITPDVIFWKNLLLDPCYNEDEEDEWITPEDCAVYSREQRPPLVIPRITQYRAVRMRNQNPYPEDTPLKSSMRPDYGGLDYSHVSSRADLERSFSKASSDSPPFGRLNKKLSGSTENMLGHPRRPQHLQIPASSSGDSLDYEVRDRQANSRHGRKSHSVHVTAKRRVLSPVPAPRTVVPTPSYQPPAEAPVLHEGPIKRTKFLEGGKKSKKNWMECYMVLTPTALVFYKDQKTYQASINDAKFKMTRFDTKVTNYPLQFAVSSTYATLADFWLTHATQVDHLEERRQQMKSTKPPGTPPSPSARLELVLPLRNALVVQCKPIHTRRHNKSLLLGVDCDQYLIQDETEKGIDRWHIEIHNVIKSFPTALTDLHSYQSSNTDLESLGRTPPASRHANNRNKQKAGGSSNEDLSDSTENSIQKSHVKRRLRDFFVRRPPMEVLRRKGYYKDEPVFGRNLEEVCSTTSPRVPEFVVACINEIESSEENMCTDGLYRASGNLSQVQKIRLEIDQTNKTHLDVIKNNTDIHVLTGSLKLFFRELKEPLIPCTMFDRILAACSIKPKDAKIKAFRDIINSLPQCNRDTLKYLLEHLLRVTQYSERNRMHTANLAIVFGPTLLWAPAEQAHNIAVDCIQQNNVVDILLNDFKEIFLDDNGKGKKKV